MESSSPVKSLKCVVVTPERAVLDEVVDFVALPMFDGELGVYPMRAPLIGKLGSGELRLVKAGKTQRYFVDGGFAQVRADVVTVLTSKAMPATELKAEDAEKALRDALQPALAPAARDAQDKAQARARAQLRIAAKIASEGELRLPQ